MKGPGAKLFLLVLLVALGGVSSCLLFYGTPEFDVPSFVLEEGDTLDLVLTDFYEGKPYWNGPLFTLDEDSVGDLSGFHYTWTRPMGDSSQHTVGITAGNGLTETHDTFKISAP